MQILKDRNILFFLVTTTILELELDRRIMKFDVVKLGSMSKVYLKSLRDLDLELDSIIACLHHHPPTIKLF